MDGVKKFFKREFQIYNFSLKHESAADFYLSCWQKNRSAVPLMIFRCLIFLGCVAILISSIIISYDMFGIGYWFIFMTHWGLIFNTFASGLALVISLRVYFQGPIDASFQLPWYVKAYWVMYNVSVPMAFFITLFYWSTLTEFSEQYAMDPVLDVFIHAVNSIVMLALVLVSRHPTRILHFYCSLVVGIIYLIFTLIFYFSGALTPFGTSYIYPNLDWGKPGETTGMVIGSAFGLIGLHLVVVAITAGRDKLTQRYKETNRLNISDNDRYN